MNSRPYSGVPVSTDLRLISAVSPTRASRTSQGCGGGTRSTATPAATPSSPCAPARRTSGIQNFKLQRNGDFFFWRTHWIMSYLGFSSAGSVGTPKNRVNEAICDSHFCRSVAIRRLWREKGLEREPAETGFNIRNYLTFLGDPFLWFHPRSPRPARPPVPLTTEHLVTRAV